MIGSRPEEGSNIANVRRLGYRVALDGANAPTLSEGPGATAARTAVGTYTLTQLDLPAGKEFKYALLSICKASGTVDIDVKDGGYNSTTGVYTFYTVLSSTGANANPPAAAATNYVSVELVFGSPVN